MTTNEAYDYAMAVAKEIEATGVAVTIKPSRSRNNPETIQKYSGPERVLPDRWMHVTFYPTTDEQRDLILQKQKALGWKGIGFDSGGGCGGRDWELDWSFRYREGEIDANHEVAMDTCEDIIRKLQNGECPLPIGPPEQGCGCRSDEDS